jgi:hypothetical protein
MGVGRFIGKLFGGGETAKDEALLRAYGKLPMYAEYRRLEVAPGPPTVFSQWMDAGRLAWVQAAAQRGDPGAVVASRLAVQLPGVKELVIASIWDSRDTVGRIFPFCFFATCPPDALGADPVERWVAACSIFREFDRAHLEMSVLGRGGDFYRHYRGRTITLRPADLAEQVRSLMQQAAQIDAQTWFANAGFAASNDGDGATGEGGSSGDAGSGRDGGVTAKDWFSSLARRSARWRSQPADVSQIAVGCPLSKEAPADVQMALWLRWLEPFARHAHRPLAMIAPAGRETDGRAGYLVLRDIMPDDFQLLTSQAAEYGFMDDLARPSAAPPDAASVVPPQGSLLSWLASQGPSTA